MLPLLDRAAIGRHAKAFIGYSDNTSILSWLTLQCGIVSFHGPMIEGRLARGEAGYDRDTFVRCLCRTEAPGEITHPRLEVIAPGEASGMLLGGTLTQLTASLGTPYAFDPPPGFVLFVDEVGERPFRIDRMLTQLRLSGILARASAVVFGELPEVRRARRQSHGPFDDRRRDGRAFAGRCCSACPRATRPVRR